MTPMIPVSTWAEKHGISRQHALNMINGGKVPGAVRQVTTAERWYVPADARPDFTDRRRKDAGGRGSPDVRSA